MYNFIIVLCFFVLTSAEICPSDKEIDSKNVRTYERLPGNVIPIHYDITLEPNIEKKSFTGSVHILIKFVNANNTIVLHADELEIMKDLTTLTCGNNEDKKFETMQNSPFLTLTLSDTLPVDTECVLQFNEFQGKLSLSDKYGLYLAAYNEDGTDKMFVTTQFEKFGARRAFPCFDEPHLKSTFTVTLIRPKNFISISNEVLDREVAETDKFHDVYKETKPMSTYLLAFIITEYSSTRTYLEQRVFADKPAINNGEAEFALQMGVKVLAALEQFTEYRYSFGKIDQIGIPDSYFDPGAMENWGLVTYRKSLLVYPYDHQTTKGLQKTVSIIAHEYSHQWFGNLVTCAWWNYLWLNEGFADYFEYFTSAMVGWDLKDLFVMDSVHNALGQDSVKGIQPMNSESATTIIVYQKSGAVIRMMSHFVTEKLFQKSLALYLKDNEYKAATPTELYKAFQTTIEAEKKTSLLAEQKISDIMETWDSQPGYPIITVTKTNDKLTLQQERFFTDNSVDNQTKWIIPITYVREGYPDDDFTITTAQAWMVDYKMELPLPSNGWVILNKQQMGYYRVMYDENNWNQLIETINKDHKQIHVLNRAQLIDDAFTFAKLDKMNYTKVFDLASYLINEDDYVPVGVFLKHISVINNKLSYASGRQGFKTFMENIFSKSKLDTLTMKENVNDALKTKYLRIELINWLCRLGNKQCTSYALEVVNGNSVISPDLQEPIYCGAMRVANQETWTMLYTKMEKETNDLVRARIVNALGCSESQDILSNYARIIFNATNTNINLLSGYRSILNAGDFGVEFIWNYTVTNFANIKDLSSAKTLLSDVSQKLNTDAHKDEVSKLIEDYPEAVAMLNESLTIINDNINWNTKYTYLKDWFEPTTTTGSAANLKVKFEVLLTFVLSTILIHCFKR